MKIISTISLFFILFIFKGCSTQNVKLVSTQLDTTLIPILYYVSQEDFMKASVPTDLLVNRWDGYKISLKNDKRIGNESQDIDKRIKSLNIHVIEQDKSKALSDFQGIQSVLSDWRRNQEIDYYLDDWYDFYFEMEMFSNIANDQLLDLHEWEDLECRMDYMMESFYFLNTCVKDLEYFEINEEQFFNHLKIIDTSLMLLLNSMECADREEVAISAKILHNDIINTLALFGDFEEEIIADFDVIL